MSRGLRWTEEQLRGFKKAAIKPVVIPQYPVTLNLPYPVSTNRYWRSVKHPKTGHTMVILSNEAKAYKARVREIGATLTPSDKPIQLSLVLIPKGKRRIDLSNCLKIAEDALQGVAYINDSQVIDIHLAYGPSDGVGGLIVTISEVL